jgi:hypothetical protein
MAGLSRAKKKHASQDVLEHAYRQHRTSHKVIQKTALARLKTAEDGYVENIFALEGAAALKRVLQRCDLIPTAEEIDKLQYLLHHASFLDVPFI